MAIVEGSNLDFFQQSSYHSQPREYKLPKIDFPKFTAEHRRSVKNIFPCIVYLHTYVHLVQPSILVVVRLCGFKEINVSFNALKRVEVDRVTVQPKNKRADTILNPFDLSDEEDSENDNMFFSHLIKDITDVDLDEPDLGMRICDLKVTRHKSKSSAKKAKAQKRPKN